MPSKKSSCNAPLIQSTLLKKNLSRFWPLWGGLSLAGSLMPLYLLLNVMSPYYSYHIDPRDVAYTFYGILTQFVPGFSLVYAILCAMLVWNYLYNARSVGLFHALPVNRRSLFLTNVLSGLCIMLIPYAVVGLLTCLVCLIFGMFPPLAVLETIVGVLGLSFFYFSTATFCAMITSHLVALPVFYFIGHFFAVAFNWLIGTFASSFIFGYIGTGISTLARFLSPTVYIYQKFQVEHNYNEVTGISTRWLSGMWVVGVYAAIGLVLYLVSYLLYRLRHSESAGDVVTYRWLRPVFRYGVALCSALTLGQLLYEVVWHAPFQKGPYYQMLPMGVCMVITGILGYYVASMLLQKSLRVFRNWQGPAIVTALVILLCGSVYFDLFSVAKTIPRQEDIKTVSVSCSYSNNDVRCGNQSPELLEDVLNLHRTIVANEDTIRADRNQDDDNQYDLTLRFSYTMEDGSTLYRKYQVPVTLETWGQEGTYANAINRLFNGQAHMEAMLQVDERMSLTSVYVDYYYAYEGPQPSMTFSQMETVYQAILQDAKAGMVYDVDPYNGDEFGSIHLEFSRPSTDGSGGVYYSADIRLSPDMTHTMAALVEVGAISAGQLQEWLGIDVTAPATSTTALPT